MKTIDKLVVTFVWGIILFESSVFLTLVAPSLFLYNIVLFLLIIPLFLINLGLLFVSYFRSTTHPPGSPNQHMNTHYSGELQEIKQKARVQSEKKKQRRKNKVPFMGRIDNEEIDSMIGVSFCFKCDTIKEERVHHCSICKRCIMRMDHHCPWVGQCVGKMNHKFFILFLFYATAGLFCVAIFITVDYFTGKFYADLILVKWLKYVYYFACLSSYMLALSIGFLFVTQMLTSVANLTTLQSFVKGIRQRNPWDKENWKENLRQIFGTSNWMLPTAPFGELLNYEASHELNSVDSL